MGEQYSNTYKARHIFYYPLLFIYSFLVLHFRHASDTPSKESPLDLVGSMGDQTKVLRKLPHCPGILLEIPADKDDVRLVPVKHPLRDLAVGDTTDGRDNELVADGSLDRP